MRIRRTKPAIYLLVFICLATLIGENIFSRYQKPTKREPFLLWSLRNALQATSQSSSRQWLVSTNSRLHRSWQNVTEDAIESEIEAFLQSFNSTNNDILPSSTASEDSVLKINNTEFHFILDPQRPLRPDFLASQVEPVLLLALVPVHARNLRQRMVVRRTWANVEVYKADNMLRTVFVCGLSNDEEQNRQLRYESYTYNDIVQADFLDTYYNLTYKSLVGIKWASRYYSPSSLKFVLKIDDDVVPHTFNISNYLNEQVTKQLPSSTNSYLCHVHRNAPVLRDPFSKFYVREKEFSSSNYPDYCDGPAYMLTMDLAQKISSIEDHSDFFKFEDVYLTGILAKRFQATHVVLSLRYLYYYDISTLGSKIPEAFFTYTYTNWNSYLLAWRIVYQCS